MAQIILAKKAEMNSNTIPLNRFTEEQKIFFVKVIYHSQDARLIPMRNDSYNGYVSANTSTISYFKRSYLNLKKDPVVKFG